ncbi:sugar phosphate isomerase/epimerase family protein [Bacteroidota bacterium]
MKSKSVTRRKFIQKTAIAGAGLPLMGTSLFNKPTDESSCIKYPVCFFSKHLQFLENYGDMADAVLETGVEGVDLTVRPGGHVEPERVEEDLPRAVEAIRKRGLLIPMMVSGINDPDDPLTERVLKTAGQLGIDIYRMSYLKYNDSMSIEQNLEKFSRMVKGLAELNEKYGIHGAYQNHNGNYFGGPVWDLWEVLKGLDSEWVGSQYDVRHAAVEGSGSWQLGLSLIRPYINCIAIKDANWEKVDGKWKPVHVPMGTGFVDHSGFLEYMKKTEFSGSITLHVEYPLYDYSDKTLTIEQKRKVSVEGIQRDANYLKQKMKESGLV